jgi:hypothetical protein
MEPKKPLTLLYSEEIGADYNLKFLNRCLHQTSNLLDFTILTVDALHELQSFSLHIISHYLLHPSQADIFSWRMLFSSRLTVMQVSPNTQAWTVKSVKLVTLVSRPHPCKSTSCHSWPHYSGNKTSLWYTRSLLHTLATWISLIWLNFYIWCYSFCIRSTYLFWRTWRVV